MKEYSLLLGLIVFVACSKPESRRIVGYETKIVFAYSNPEQFKQASQHYHDKTGETVVFYRSRDEGWSVVVCADISEFISQGWEVSGYEDKHIGVSPNKVYWSDDGFALTEIALEGRLHKLRKPIYGERTDEAADIVGYDTKVVFVPEPSEEANRIHLFEKLELAERLLAEEEEVREYAIRQNKYLPDVYHICSNINVYTRVGWEIKSSRRAWTNSNEEDIENWNPAEGGPENYKIWGTEYTLQKVIRSSSPQ